MHATARMRCRTAQIQTPQRYGVGRPAGDRPEDQQLVGGGRTASHITTDQVGVPLLQAERRGDRGVDHQIA